MELSTWISYVAMITALIAFPGPSSLLITMHGYRYGIRRTHYTIVAHLIGSLLLMILSALGLGLIIATSEVLFSVIKYLGAAYLIYLGITTWRKDDLSTDALTGQAAQRKSTLLMLKQGFLTEVSNPKDLVFFAALFPVFINPEQAILGQFLILMITWLVIDYVLKIVYSLAGKRINRQFSNCSFTRWFNRITGGMFIVAGLALAGSNQK